MHKFICSIAAAATLFGICSCDESRIFDDDDNDSDGRQFHGDVGTLASTPDFMVEIPDWSGTLADDASSDVAQDDENIYYEANKFPTIVNVTFDGEQATVTSTSNRVLTHTDGAYVTVDMQTNSVSSVEVKVSGTTSNGGLKIYGEKKFKLTLNNANITSQRGPAINNQCKKRVFLHLADGTVNKLCDTSTYTADSYNLTTATEDRKGCFFSEGNTFVSGHGAMVVTGRYRHAIAIDGSLYIRPGATVVVNDAAKNALHIKGDSKEGYGIAVMGGLLHLTTTGAAGKGIKTDLNMNMFGGKVVIRTSGDAIFDSTDNDTSSASAISTDGGLSITGGALQLCSTGIGGKGLNVSGDFQFNNATLDVWTTGKRYTYTAELTAASKAVKCDGSISISGGTLRAAALGGDEGCDAMNSKNAITISKGDLQLYASDDAMNATTAITIQNGNIMACSTGSAGITTKGTLTISNGYVEAYGGNVPGIAFTKATQFHLKGGELIAVGPGDLITGTTATFAQPAAQTSNLMISYDETLALTQTGGSSSLFTIKPPVSYPNAVLVVSLPSLQSGKSYTLSIDGTSQKQFTASSSLVTF